jgi:hypothetical protein
MCLDEHVLDPQHWGGPRYEDISVHHRALAGMDFLEEWIVRRLTADAGSGAPGRPEEGCTGGCCSWGSCREEERREDAMVERKVLLLPSPHSEQTEAPSGKRTSPGLCHQVIKRDFTKILSFQSPHSKPLPQNMPHKWTHSGRTGRQAGEMSLATAPHWKQQLRSEQTNCATSMQGSSAQQRKGRNYRMYHTMEESPNNTLGDRAQQKSSYWVSNFSN